MGTLGTTEKKLKIIPFHKYSFCFVAAEASTDERKRVQNNLPKFSAGRSVDNVMISLLRKQKSKKLQKEDPNESNWKKSERDIDETIKLLLYLEKKGNIEANPVLFTWWGNIAKCFLNCYRWRKGKMGRPNGCTCD